MTPHFGSLIFLLCSSLIINVWSQNDIASLYPVLDKSNCVFPFTYNGQTYKDCTTDGNNGDILWCSLTKDYQGILTYCYDFRKTTLQCLPSFKMPNGKTYTGCDYLSTTQLYKQCRTNNSDVPYRYCTDALSSTGPVSLKRNPNCNPSYANLAYDHSMCYGPSIHAFPVPFTATEKSDMLDLHSSYRSGVSSRYMFKLYWDDELTKLAQARANMCFFEHDLAVNRLSPQFGWKNGQNIAMSSETRSTPDSLFDDMLSAEQQNFQYGQDCNPTGTCLHYTQAMLSNLTRVGCGQAHCVFPDRIERYVVCNYIQSQYSDNYETPYVPSDIPAADCPAKAQNGLCDCGNKICNYNKNERLDPNTCACIPPSGKRSIEKRDINSPSIEKPKLKHVSHHQIGARSIEQTHHKFPYHRGVGKRNVPRRLIKGRKE